MGFRGSRVELRSPAAMLALLRNKSRRPDWGGPLASSALLSCVGIGVCPRDGASRRGVAGGAALAYGDARSAAQQIPPSRFTKDRWGNELAPPVFLLHHEGCRLGLPFLPVGDPLLSQPEGTMGSLLLVPVADAGPPVQYYYGRYRDDDAPRDAKHMRELARLTIRFVRASEALWGYAELVGGTPSRN